MSIQELVNSSAIRIFDSTDADIDTGTLIGNFQELIDPGLETKVDDEGRAVIISSLETLYSGSNARGYWHRGVRLGRCISGRGDGAQLLPGGCRSTAGGNAKT